MSRLVASFVAVAVTFAFGNSSFAQSPTIRGAWKVVAFTGADGKTNASPEPGYYIFTDRHYSVQVVRQPRSPMPEKPSDKDQAAAFGPYTANTGTYELKGTTLTRKVLAAKNPAGMSATAKPIVEEVRFEGASTVYITGTGQAGKSTTKLQRVE